MDIKKNSGFTILETTLVLAISSLLLILMLTGVTLAVQRQRFSDSVNGSQSFIQQQFNYTQNTTNDRPIGKCDLVLEAHDVRGSSGCLIIGKLLELTVSAGDAESHIIAYDVIGRDVDVEDATHKDLSDLELINSITPTAIEPGSSDYIVPWGAHINISSIRDANDISLGSEVRFVALLRSPRSGVIHVYKLGDPFIGGGLTLPQNLAAGSPPSIQEIDTSVKMCFSSVDLANYGAMLDIMPSGSQDGVGTHFDDGRREAYGCA